METPPSRKIANSKAVLCDRYLGRPTPVLYVTSSHISRITIHRQIETTQFNSSTTACIHVFSSILSLQSQQIQQLHPFLMTPVAGTHRNCDSDTVRYEAVGKLDHMRSKCKKFLDQVACLDLSALPNHLIPNSAAKIEAVIVTNSFMGTVRDVLRASLPLVLLLRDQHDKFEYAQINSAYAATVQKLNGVFKDGPNATRALDALGYARCREFIQTMVLLWADVQVGVYFWISQLPREPITWSVNATMLYHPHVGTRASMSMSTIPFASTQQRSLQSEAQSHMVYHAKKSMPDKDWSVCIPMLITCCQNLLAGTQSREREGLVHSKWVSIRGELTKLMASCDDLWLQVRRLEQLGSRQAKSAQVVEVGRRWKIMVSIYECLGCAAYKRGAAFMSSKRWTDLNTAFRDTQNSLAILGIPSAHFHHPDENVPSVDSGSKRAVTHNLAQQLGDVSATLSSTPYSHDVLDGVTPATVLPYSCYSLQTNAGWVGGFTSNDPQPASSTQIGHSLVHPPASLTVDMSSQVPGSRVHDKTLDAWRSMEVSALWK